MAAPIFAGKRSTTFILVFLVSFATVAARPPDPDDDDSDDYDDDYDDDRDGRYAREREERRDYGLRRGFELQRDMSKKAATQMDEWRDDARRIRDGISSLEAERDSTMKARDNVRRLAGLAPVAKQKKKKIAQRKHLVPIVKGDRVVVKGRAGIVSYGPDVEGECKVKFDDGKVSGFISLKELKREGEVDEEPAEVPEQVDESPSEGENAEMPAPGSGAPDVFGTIHFDFEGSLDGWEKIPFKGRTDAFDLQPYGPLPGTWNNEWCIAEQGCPGEACGCHGNYAVSTYENPNHHKANERQGILQSPEFEIEKGAEVSFWVAGGDFPVTSPSSWDADQVEHNKQGVTLEVVTGNGYDVVQSAAGRQDGIMRKIEWPDLDRHAGSTLRLRMYDTGPGGWQISNLDNVVITHAREKGAAGTGQARIAQAVHAAALARHRDAEKKLKDLDARLSPLLTGGQRALAELSEKCLQMRSSRDLYYKVCFFDHAYQEGKPSDKVSLGHWAGWEEKNGKLRGVFEGGDECPDGTARRLFVNLKCGGESSLRRVTEGKGCTYDATVFHPGACDPSQEPEERRPKKKRREL